MWLLLTTCCPCTSVLFLFCHIPLCAVSYYFQHFFVFCLYSVILLLICYQIYGPFLFIHRDYVRCLCLLPHFCTFWKWRLTLSDFSRFKKTFEWINERLTEEFPRRQNSQHSERTHMIRSVFKHTFMTKYNFWANHDQWMKLPSCDRTLLDLAEVQSAFLLLTA